MTPEDYDALYEAQRGLCAICGEHNPTLVVDHDHSCCPTPSHGGEKHGCGRCNRGLLCNRCNVLLGMARDNPDVLREAVEYLSNYELF